MQVTARSGQVENDDREDKRGCSGTNNVDFYLSHVLLENSEG